MSTGHQPLFGNIDLSIQSDDCIGVIGATGRGKRALLRQPNMLLDEPSNHLDLPALLWLERFLQSSAFVLLSHDGRLRDRVTRGTLSLRDRRIYRFAPGGPMPNGSAASTPPMATEMPGEKTEEESTGVLSSSRCATTGLAGR